MKNLSILLLLVFFLSAMLSCEDSDSALLFNKKQKRMKVILRDTYSETMDTTADKIPIYLSRNDRADPYLYQIATDVNGQFTLQYIPNDDDIFVVGKYTSIDKIEYRGYSKISTLSETLLLEAKYIRGKVKVIFSQTKDENSDQADPVIRINSAEVYLFTSKQQAQTFLSDSGTKGALIKKSTNAKGIALFYNLDRYTYYVVGRFTDPEGKTIYSEIKDAPVTSVDDNSTPLDISINAKVNRTLIITAYDSNNPSNFLAKVDVYLFKDASNISSLTHQNGPFGFERQATTSANGEAKFDNLKGSSYYVGLRFKRTDGKIFASPTGKLVTLTTAETRDHHEIRWENTPFKVTLTGSGGGGPINNAVVYLFSNREQAKTLLDQSGKGPVGEFRQVNTLQNGEANFADVFEGNYYIGVKIPTTDNVGLRKLLPTPAPEPAPVDVSHPHSFEL